MFIKKKKVVKSNIICTKDNEKISKAIKSITMNFDRNGKRIGVVKP